jgi:O-antigen ligase
LAYLTQHPPLPGRPAVPGAGLFPAAPSTSAVAFTVFHILGFWSLLAFLVVAFSRVNEFIPIPYAVKTPILICLAMGFLTAGLFRAMTSRPGMLLFMLTFWMCLSTPFSIWKGGSVRLLMETWLISLLIFFAISGAIHSLDQVRKAMYAMAAASFLIMLLSFRFGGGERLSFAWGTLGNPNDFAAYLLLGTPFCFYVFFDQSKLSLLKVGAVVGLLGIFILSLRSGSRAGFVTILGITLVMFWKLSLANKVKLMIVGLVAAPLLVPFVPSATWQRLTTFGSAEAEARAENPEVGAASTSYYARRRLLTDAIELTVRNPLLGVGPGQFAPAAAGMSAAEDVTAMWRETHNTYLQLSSECGLPALALYLALLSYCFRSMTALRRGAVHRPELASIVTMANCIYMAAAVFAFVALFGSYGYTMMLPAYAAFAEALYRTSRPLIRAASTPSENSPARELLAPAAPSLAPRTLVRS